MPLASDLLLWSRTWILPGSYPVFATNLWPFMVLLPTLPVRGTACKLGLCCHLGVSRNDAGHISNAGASSDSC